MEKKPRNKFSKIGNEHKDVYFKRIINMLVEHHDYGYDEAYEKCAEKWSGQINCYVKFEDRFIYDSF